MCRKVEKGGFKIDLLGKAIKKRVKYMIVPNRIQTCMLDHGRQTLYHHGQKDPYTNIERFV